MKQRAEQIASDNLQSFKSGDKSARVELADTLVKTVREAEDNTKKLLPALKLLSTRVNYLASNAANSRMHQSALNLLINAILGNRDNKSYYLMDGAANWIDRRLASVNEDGAKKALIDAKDAIIEARETLDKTGYAFGAGVITIRKLIDSNDANKWNQVKEVANNMYTKVTTAPVLEQFANALEKSGQAQDSFFWN